MHSRLHSGGGVGISFGFSATIKDPSIPSKQNVGSYTTILDMVLKSNPCTFRKMNPRPTEPDSNFTA